MTGSKPPEFADALGPYEALVYGDYGSRHPLGWGFRLVERLGETRFEALRQLAQQQGWTVACLIPGVRWGLVIRWLTHEEATAQYGAVTGIERGPKGGFRSITFGAAKFIGPEARCLLPPDPAP